MRIFILILALVLMCGTVTLANGVGAGKGPAETPQPVPQMETPAPVVPPAPPAPVTAAPCPTPASCEMLTSACFASCLNLTSDQLMKLQSQGLTNTDIAMAVAISGQSNVPIDQIVNEWKNCSKNWMTVAGNHNLTMANLCAMPIVADMTEESFNRTFFSQYYNIPMTQVVALRQQNWSWGAINVMANAATRTNQPISQIASLRSQGSSWNDIASRYNVASADFTMPMQMRTVTAMRSMAGAGPAVSPVIYDNRGNVLLTQDQVNYLYRSGYDWLDVAIAANISMSTGYPVQEVLMQMKTGNTWEGIAQYYGVPPEIALNVANYPFPRVSSKSQSSQADIMNRIQKYQKPYGPMGGTITPSGMVCPGTCPQPFQPAVTGVGPAPCSVCPQPCPKVNNVCPQPTGCICPSGAGAGPAPCPVCPAQCPKPNNVCPQPTGCICPSSK